MSRASKYDVIVIGAGSAGFSAAAAARELGASVCLIEKEKLGGECPNWACNPSKALLQAAKVYRQMQNARHFGTIVKGAEFDFTKIMEYRQDVVETITGGGEVGERYLKMAKQLEIEIELGTATFINEHTIEVNNQSLTAQAIVIAAGAVDFVPQIDGLKPGIFWTFREAVTSERQPKSLAIIGGGPVGCELATFYGTLGTRVVLLQSSPYILNREDEEIAKIAQESIEQHGVEVISNAQITQIIDGRGGVYGVKVEDKEGNEQTHAVEQLLVVAGKKSNTKDLGLDRIDVRLDERGSINTNEEQRTNIKHIFAAGDVDGGMMFTHTAHYEGKIAGHNAARLALKKRNDIKKSDQRVVPRVTFVDPEVASVGLTQEQAKKKFKEVLVGRFKVGSLSRAVTESKPEGLVKIVAHPKTRKVLGCHIVSVNAGEIVHEAALAIYLGATVDKISSMIHAYPTYSEALVGAAGQVELEA
ncbi:dihydrolipoyl dehydrogenase family protein [Patescibacteria group bacterium]